MSSLTEQAKQTFWGKTSPRQKKVTEVLLKSHIYQITVADIADLFNVQHSYEDRKQDLIKKFDGVNGLIQKLQSDTSSGIQGDERDIQRRQNFFGKNQKPEMILPSFWSSLKEATEDRIYFVLAIAAAFSILFGMIYSPKTGWWPGVSIFISLFIMIFITAICDYDKDKRFIELRIRSNESKVTVVRGRIGETQQVTNWNLCVGDICQFGPGSHIPVDCVVVKSTGLSLDEAKTCDAVMVPVGKGVDTDPFLLSGSFVISGTCTAVVAAVGANSTREHVAMQAEALEDTPLQNKLFKLSKSFTYIGFFSALVILITSLVVVVIQTGVNDDMTGRIFLKKLCENLTIAIILIIVSIPEGLPMTVAVSLAHTTKLMQQKNDILVRNLKAPELMAQVNELCCGLTGSLTTGEMRVELIYAQNITIKNERDDTFYNCALSKTTTDLIEDAILYCNECHIEINENAEYEPKGNDTEVSLLNWLKNADVNLHQRMLQRLDLQKASVPFDSKKRRQIVAIKHPALQNVVRVFMKGAPEGIIEKCTSHFDASGNKAPMNDEDKTYLKEKMEENMDKQLMRTIAFSFKDYTEANFKQLVTDTQNFTKEESADTTMALDHTFIGLIALNDPLRASAKASIKYAKIGHINIRLVTNNSLEYAKAQAYECGIVENKSDLDQSGVAMTGKEFSDLYGPVSAEGNELKNQIAFNNAIEDLKVLARATSDDKNLLAVGLKNQGQQLAMVGDSLNDIEAFKNSCVSICFGSSPDFAKQNADFVLEDLDFDNVTSTFMYGRNIYTNIKRFLQFQITCNWTVLIIELLGYCYLTETPLNAVQLLWINLVMDTFAALALATSPPFTTVILEPIVKVGGGGQVLTKPVWRQIYGITLWNTIIMCIVIFGGKNFYDLDYTTATQTTDRMAGNLTQAALDKKMHFTMIFNTYFWLCWFNEINCRVVGYCEFNPFKNLLSSPMYIATMLLTAFVQWSAVHWFSFLFGTISLQPSMFWKGVVMGSTVLAAAFVLKLIPQSVTNKIPASVDEDKVHGENTGMMRFYDNKCKVKVDYSQMKKKAVNQNASQPLLENSVSNFGPEDLPSGSEQGPVDQEALLSGAANSSQIVDDSQKTTGDGYIKQK